MSFQAYLDNVRVKAGTAPKNFSGPAKAESLNLERYSV